MWVTVPQQGVKNVLESCASLFRHATADFRLTA